ncbi:MAG: hypothetical protein KAI29_19995, partial [Cyclobacteriaceae bacterium]|nr:hypothetical protein [Cyclobacteriaceae bacterium]
MSNSKEEIKKEEPQVEAAVQDTPKADAKEVAVEESENEEETPVSEEKAEAPEAAKEKAEEPEAKTEVPEVKKEEKTKKAAEAKDDFNWDDLDSKSFGEEYSEEERKKLEALIEGTLTTVNEKEVVEGLVV